MQQHDIAAPVITKLPQSSRAALCVALVTLAVDALACPSEPRQVRYQDKCLDADALTTAFVCPDGTTLQVEDNDVFWTRKCLDTQENARGEETWIVTSDADGLPMRRVVQDAQGNGTFTHFHVGGGVHQTIPTASWAFHGIAKVYDESGDLVEEGPWEAGELHGLWKTFEGGKQVVESCSVRGQRLWDNPDESTFGTRPCPPEGAAAALDEMPAPDLTWAHPPTEGCEATDLLVTPQGVAVSRNVKYGDAEPALLLFDDPARFRWGADGTGQLGRVALHGDSLVAHWIGDGTLRIREERAPAPQKKKKSPDGSLWRVVAENIASSRNDLLHTDGKTIWWIATDEDEYIDRVFRAGWAGGRKVLATATGRVRGTARDSEFLYWTDDEGIKRIKYSGGKVETVASGIDQLGTLEVHGEWVYFSTGGRMNFRPQVGDGAIYRVQRSGGEPELVVSWGDIADDFLIVDDWLYWGAFEEIARMPLDGSMQPILMVLDVTFPKNLAVSGGRLWFTDNDCAVGHVDARARYTWE